MPAHETTVRELEEALAEQPLLDAHTHLDTSHLAARGLDDILLYHMVVSDLYAAGCPDGARLSEWPDDAEAEGRIERAIPYLPHIVNTSCYWGMRIALRDLYGWTDTITSDNWRTLHAQIRERAGDAAWPREVLDRAGIQRTCTEYARRHDGSADDRLQYNLEWAFFNRVQWGAFDTPVYELEMTRSCHEPAPPLPVTLGDDRPAPEMPIRTLENVEEALDHYFAVIPFDRLISTAQHIATDMNLRRVTDADMADALTRRAEAGPEEQDIYSSYLLEGFCNRLEALERPIVYQFSTGAEALPFETGSRMRQETLGQLADLIARHPKMHFQCFLSSMHANQTLCTFARELPNLSLIGFWWHNFFPPFMKRILHERLDMLPVNKQIGFFTDAYCADWSYAKSVMIRRILAEVLAEKIARGQYDKELALTVAHAINYETARNLNGMVPR